LTLRTARLHTPPSGMLDAGLRPRPFPDDTASLLPGPLTATRTGLSPASDDELTNQPSTIYMINHQLSGHTKANPYGVYDVGANTGWVSVGTDHDTASFAVNTIKNWWLGAGKTLYPNANRLMISADGGGSNGYRTRQWKTELAALAADTGLAITVCHLPPGTSKWNKIEHRLFSHISMNWRGRPLTSHEVIVETIAATTTSTGLTVHAELDEATYPTGVKITDKEMKALETQDILKRHDFHGEWNYTLNPLPRHARNGRH
jgi:hypothetical protein